LIFTAILLLSPLTARAARVASGSYTGNGADNRLITGLGFQPNFVLVQSDGGNGGVMRFEGMPEDKAALFGSGTLVSNTLQRFLSDGFEIGNSSRVNANGITYYWLALAGAGGEDDYLSYLGDGTDNRAIGGLNFQPDFVLVAGDAKGHPFWRTGTISGDKSLRLSGGSKTNRLQALLADGFEVGSAGAVNQKDKNFYAMAWRTTAGTFAWGSYTGDGQSARTISGLGFQPDAVFVKREDGEKAVVRTAEMKGDEALVLNNRLRTNTIQSFSPDGFVLGTHKTVNATGKVYHWLAWKDVIPDTTPPDPPQASPAGGTFSTSQNVVLTAETGATIYYTVDGSAPSLSASVYTGPLTISTTTTLKAIAVDAAGNESGIMEELYQIISESTNEEGNLGEDTEDNSQENNSSSGTTGGGAASGGDAAGATTTSAGDDLVNAQVNLREGKVLGARRVIEVKSRSPVTLSATPPDPDRLQRLFLRIDGKTYFLNPRGNIYQTTLPALTAGEKLAYTLVANYGSFTLAEKGTIIASTEQGETLNAEQVESEATQTLPSGVSGANVAPVAAVPSSPSPPSSASPPKVATVRELITPPSPQTSTLPQGEVAGIFLRSLIRVAYAEEVGSPHLESTWQFLRRLDASLIVLGSLSLAAILSVVAYLVHISKRHALPLGHTVRMVPMGWCGDPAERFNYYAPRNRRTGEIKISFSLTKRIARLYRHALIAFSLCTVGKVIVGVGATLLLLFV
jgi:hypothetical protein